jgi:CheY-like chemotaxis protein
VSITLVKPEWTALGRVHVARVVVYHNKPELRRSVAEALHERGAIAYHAGDARRAWLAINALRPDVVVTDYPAYLSTGFDGRITLTDLIRSTPGFERVAILNLSYSRSDDEESGMCSLPPSAQTADIVSAVLVLASHASGC